MEAIWIIVGLLVAWAIWKYGVQGGTNRGVQTRAVRRVPPPVATAPTVGELFKWPTLNQFDFEVVGESNYQPALRKIAGDHGAESVAMDCIATLVPDDANAYDKSAVQVSVNGEVVGYLSRDDARSFRRRLGRKGLTGQATTCAAKVVGGGTKRGGERLMYGIQLDMKPFDN